MELSHSCFISWCGRCLICVICHGNSYHSILFKLYQLLHTQTEDVCMLEIRPYILKLVETDSLHIDGLPLSGVLKKDLLIFC